MDIKKLLIMQQVIPIVRFMCLRVKRKRYSIHYVVKNSILTVENIKRIRKGKSLRSRLQKRKRNFIRKLMHHRSQAISRKSKRSVLDMGVGTERVDLRNVYTNTSVKTFNQRTNTRLLFTSNAKIQTEVFTSSISTQCRIPAHERACQTDNSKNTMSAQTELLVVNKDSQTDMNDWMDAKELKGNFVDVSNMLTEVSQLVLHQNNIISNNSTMLGHLSEIMLLNKFTDNQEDAEKFVKNSTLFKGWHGSSIRSRSRRSFKDSSYGRKKKIRMKQLKYCRKTKKSSIILVDACQQTDEVEIQHKFTQTISKATFFPGFFKNPS